MPTSYFTDTSRLNRPYGLKRPQEYYNAIPRLAKQYGPGQQLDEDNQDDPVRNMLNQTPTPSGTYGVELANRLANRGSTATSGLQSQMPSQASTAQSSQKGFSNPYMQQLQQIGQFGKQANARVEAISAFKNKQNTLGNLDLSGVEGARAKLIAAAKGQLGVPYVWGGETRGKAFDCSGLVQFAYRSAGIKMPRVAAAQMTRGHITSINNLKPGDLVGWGHPAHHIAIYLGGGRIIEAPHTGLNVRITSLGKKGGGAWGIHLNI